MWIKDKKLSIGFTPTLAATEAASALWGNVRETDYV